MQLKISGRQIGEGAPCFVIAEAGVNHNGDMSLARQLIDAAAQAGADAVKFQTFNAASLVTGYAEKAAYQRETTSTEESHYEMLVKLELSAAAHKELKDYADKRGIIFLSTPYDKESIDLLVELGVPALKISSADITDYPLLAQAAATGLPVILSTGMSTMEEIESAVKVTNDNGNRKLALLHCTFNYPARVEDLNLRAMETLKKAFGLPVGYSDHTMGFEVSLAAVALGATIIEKHFTMNRSLPGPDHRASLEPEEIKEMIQGIRNIEKALGLPEKRPTGDEAANRSVSRRSIVAAENIAEGATITAAMLAAKRPGTGISPAHFNEIVGRKAAAVLQKDELLTWEKLR